jgi:hypothetical protein
MNKYAVFAIVLIFAVAASFFAGYKSQKTEEVYVDVPKTIIDTTYVKVEPVEYKQLKAKHHELKIKYAAALLEAGKIDTVKIAVHDTLISVDVASIDTALISGGHNYGRLFVSYTPPPFDMFGIEFHPEPLPVVTVTKFVDKKKRFYEQPVFNLAAGALFGLGFSIATK